MAVKVSVEVCGPTLSCLHYEIANSHGDQEGFLIGDVTTRVTDGISDSELNFETQEVIVSIHSAVPAGTIGEFYTGVGEIKEEVIKNIIGPRYKDLIGWYRFRRNSTLDMFLREQKIHQNILDTFPLVKREFFICGILTSTRTANCATHEMDHVFLCCKNQKSFESIPLSVVNLGDTSQAKYRLNPPLVLERQRGIYGKLINSLKHSVLDSTGTSPSISQIRDLQASLQVGLKNLCHQVSESEMCIVTLDAEIKELKEQIQKVEDRDLDLEIQKTNVENKQMLSPSNCPVRSSATSPDNSRWSPSGNMQERNDKSKVEVKTIAVLPPSDMSNAENSIRKVTRHSPVTELKMQIVNIEGSDGQPKIEDNGHIIKDNRKSQKGGNKQSSPLCSRAPT